jgi:hypothetical protein
LLVGAPVGILTSSEDVRDRHRATLLSAERYIYKPPMLEEFIDQVGGAVVEMLPTSRSHDSETQTEKH